MREQTASIRPTLDGLKTELALIRSDLGAAQLRQNELHAALGNSRNDENGGGATLLRELHAQIDKRASAERSKQN